MLKLGDLGGAAFLQLGMTINYGEMVQTLECYSVLKKKKERETQASETERGNVNIYHQEKPQRRDANDDVPENAGPGKLKRSVATRGGVRRE